MWALKGAPYHNFGVYEHTIKLHGAFGWAFHNLAPVKSVGPLTTWTLGPLMIPAPPASGIAEDRPKAGRSFPGAPRVPSTNIWSM